MSRIALVAFLAGVCASTAFPAACNNPAIQWTIVNNDAFGSPYGIQNDSKGAYINGQSGVTAAIQVCSGSGDAKLNFSSKTTRSVTASFAKMLTTNQYTPSFALTGSKTTGVTAMSIRNLFFIPAGSTLFGVLCLLVHWMIAP